MDRKKSIRILALAVMMLSAICMTGCKKEKRVIDEVQVQACMKPLIDTGVDSLKAEDICRCTLEALLEIEPNFLYMMGNEVNQLIEIHQEELMEKCDELRELYY